MSSFGNGRRIVSVYGFLLLILNFAVVFSSVLPQSEDAAERRMHPDVRSYTVSSSSSTGPHSRQRRDMPLINFNPPPIEEFSDYWNNVGQNILQKQLSKSNLNENVAKNVILFLADGMSIPTITAARVYLGGEEKSLSFEKFPYVGLAKTYCANTQVADSACTATAYLSGVKANYGTIGVSAAVGAGDCKAQNNTEYHVSSIAEWAQQKSKGTGLVTTTAVTHASPAGIYAHSANRNWESDGYILEENGNPEECQDIAKQLVSSHIGHELNIIFGGGRKHFLPEQEVDISGQNGERKDNTNLIDFWLEDHLDDSSAVFVQNRDELLNVSSDVRHIMGLFDSYHMPFHLDANKTKYPTLSEMVGKALDALEKHENGYFLFVEGGRIDHAHHDTEAVKAIDETIEFDKAVQLARERTSEKDTLIVVTSDHSHTMSIAGYSSRKNDIFGISNSQVGNDKLPYATLSYANGPGFMKNMIQKEGKRRNLREINMHDKNYRFPSLVPLDSETHGGDDVAVFASGPFAHLFTGVYEQNLIPHAMAYASCIGPGLTACSN